MPWLPWTHLHSVIFTKHRKWNFLYIYKLIAASNNCVTYNHKKGRWMSQLILTTDLDDVYICIACGLVIKPAGFTDIYHDQTQKFPLDQTGSKSIENLYFMTIKELNALISFQPQWLAPDLNFSIVVWNFYVFRFFDWWMIVQPTHHVFMLSVPIGRNIPVSIYFGEDPPTFSQ